MTKLSAVVLAAVAFAAISVDAASISVPSNPSTSSTLSNQVFSRANDFVYHQASRDAPNDKRSDVYEREPFESDSELSSRETSSTDLWQNAIHATIAGGTAVTKMVKGLRRNEMEDSALSTRDDNNNELERRMLGKVIGLTAAYEGAVLLWDKFKHKNGTSDTEKSNS